MLQSEDDRNLAKANLDSSSELLNGALDFIQNVSSILEVIIECLF